MLFKIRYKRSDCDIFVKNNVPSISYDKVAYRIKRYQIQIISSCCPYQDGSIDNVNYAGELNLTMSSNEYFVCLYLLDEIDRFKFRIFEQFTLALKKYDSYEYLTAMIRVTKIIPIRYSLTKDSPHPRSDAMCVF